MEDSRPQLDPGNGRCWRGVNIMKGNPGKGKSSEGWMWCIWVIVNRATGVLQEEKTEWKQLTCPSAAEWTNKTWCTPMVEYCPAIKRKKALTHATKEKSLENRMLNERRQIKSITCYVTLFTWDVPKRQIYRDRADYWLPGDAGWKGELQQMYMRNPLGMMVMF